MSHFDLTALNQAFAIPNQVFFQQTANGLIAAEIANAHACATLLLQGAQLTQWTAHGQKPAIWLSPAAKFSAGKAVRGGIPVCWPWFGDAAEPGCPAHGYARTTVWEVVETIAREDGATCLILRLPPNLALWSHDTPLEIRFTVGKSLAIELLTRNLGEESVIIGQALHTYFQVADVRRIEIQGLEGCEYFDKLDGQYKLQTGPIFIDNEVDRVYRDKGRDCLLDDPGLKRRIRISKRGSHSTVVWNPWVEKSRRLGDLGEEGYLGMVCVETANAGEDVIELAPGVEHRLSVEYSLEGL